MIISRTLAEGTRSTGGIHYTVIVSAKKILTFSCDGVLKV